LALEILRLYPGFRYVHRSYHSIQTGQKTIFNQNDVC